MTWTITEVGPRLFRIDTALGGRVVSLYFVRGDDASMLFDTGVRGTIPNDVVPAVRSVGIDPLSIETVVVSHCDADHFGGIQDVRAHLPGARIIAHPADRPIIEDYPTFVRDRADGFSADYGLDEDRDTLAWIRTITGEGAIDGDAEEGQLIELGGFAVEVWHVPGHTRGHVAIDVPHAAAVLVADAVLGSSVDLADGTPAFPPTYRHVAAYRSTIERLKLADRDVLLTAHYPTMRGAEAAEFLKRSATFTDRLEAMVLAEVSARAEGVTLEDLLNHLNPLAGEWPSSGTAGALAYPVAGHLEDLASRGLVRQARTNSRAPLWFAQ